jgi:NAD(P)-dependent dehydrogenase (short-subunit alcohol dehydrogenase family)
VPLTRLRRDATGDSFAGQVVVVTGAGSGIGREMALLFARLGAHVHCADINGASAGSVADEVKAASGSAAAHTVDCTDAAAVEALAETVFADGRGVDVLCNNAGIGHAGPIDETTLEDWQRVIAVNVMGVVHGIHSFVPRLLDQGRPAHIVNTASLAGLVATPQMAPYCSSKFAVVGMSESLDAELRDRGIRVTALCPGIIYTPIIANASMEGEIASRREKVIDFYRTRGVTPDVVARDTVAAIRSKRAVQPSPRSHVVPPWLIKRISPRLSAVIGRRLFDLIQR